MGLDMAQTVLQLDQLTQSVRGASQAREERLTALINANEVDIVHARSRAPAWSARRAARQTGARFVTTFHAPYNLGLPLKRLYNSVMANGDRVIAISAFIARHVIDTYGVDPDRVRLIHLGDRQVR